jgi:hypothetical protein
VNGTLPDDHEVAVRSCGYGLIVLEASRVRVDLEVIAPRRLTSAFTEGNGTTTFPGSGSGVTWNCATDTNIANKSANCALRWGGGSFASTVTDSVTHTNGMTGTVEWDVTSDIQSATGASIGWILKKASESQTGRVEYYSKEGAAAAGDPDRGPRLVIVTGPSADTTPPVVTPPSPITVAAVDASGTPWSDAAIAAFLAGATATDDVSGVLTPTNDAPAIFPLGLTTVVFSATDAAGNTGTASSTVTVTDQDPPSISTPAPVSVKAVSSLGAPKTHSVIEAFLNAATALDNVDGPRAVGNDAPADFPLGATTVTFTAADTAGNTSSATSTVTVLDTTPPNLTVPAPITVSAVNASGAPVTDIPIQDFLNAASAMDLVDPDPYVTHDAPASGSLPLRTSTVQFTATDDSGNSTTASSTITVADRTPPTLTVPPDTTLTTANPMGIPASDPQVAAFLSSATAADAIDPTPTVTHDAPANFPLGTTAVTFTARDVSGNTSSGTASLTVVLATDTTPPLVTAPSPITVPAASEAGTPKLDAAIAAFLAAATAVDDVAIRPRRIYRTSSTSLSLGDRASPARSTRSRRTRKRASK